MCPDLSGAALRYGQEQARAMFEEPQTVTAGSHGKPPAQYKQMTRDMLAVKLDQAFRAGAEWAND